MRTQRLPGCKKSVQEISREFHWITTEASRWSVVAEEVEKVNPDLVTRDAHGKVFAVR